MSSLYTTDVGTDPSDEFYDYYLALDADQDEIERIEALLKEYDY